MIKDLIHFLNLKYKHGYDLHWKRIPFAVNDERKFFSLSSRSFWRGEDLCLRIFGKLCLTVEFLPNDEGINMTENEYQNYLKEENIKTTKKRAVSQLILSGFFFIYSIAGTIMFAINIFSSIVMIIALMFALMCLVGGITNWREYKRTFYDYIMESL